METNPLEEWQRLAALYREMGDIEIRELAAGLGNLTETAQQVLREELNKRGLSEEPAGEHAPGIVRQNAAVHFEPTNYQYDVNAPNLDTDGPQEYTWKTPLCECDTMQEALPIALVLKQAGIDSWIDRPHTRLSMSGPRILVAADQREQALEILSRPIPPDIIAQSQEMEETPAFEAPACPNCGAADPTLESIDPSNAWRCESCGAEWTDPGEP